MGAQQLRKPLPGGIIDAAVRPDSQRTAVSQNKVAWILLQVFLGVVGAAVHFLAIRPKLIAAAAGPAVPVE